MKISPPISKNDINIDVKGLDGWKWLITHDDACPISVGFRPQNMTQNTSAFAKFHYIESKQHSQRNTNQSHHNLQKNMIQSKESNKVRLRGCALIIIIVSLLEEVWTFQYCYIAPNALYLGSTQSNKLGKWQHSWQDPM
jgi:hypothetical protein